MSKNGYVHAHFLCHLSPTDDINCIHETKITADSALTIDKDGTEGSELAFTFLPGDAPHDIGIKGNVPGRFKLYCETTSPFFMSQGKLKIKKNEIDIFIDEIQPDGWYGSVHGHRWSDVGDWVPGNLYYVYNHPEDAADVEISIVRTSGPYAAIGVKMNGGDPSYATTNAYLITTPGPYVFDIYADGQWGTSGLGTYDMDAKKNGVLIESKNIRQRGRQWLDNTYLAQALDAQFTENFGQTLDSFSPEGLTFAVDSIAENNWDGTITFNGDDFTASGKFVYLNDDPAATHTTIKAFPPSGSPKSVVISMQRTNPP